MRNTNHEDLYCATFTTFLLLDSYHHQASCLQTPSD